MLKVSAVEFQRNIDKYQDIALREPVEITRSGHKGTVIMSSEDYDQILRGRRRVMRLEDFTEEDLKAIEEAEIPEEARAFDHEVED